MSIQTEIIFLQGPNSSINREEYLLGRSVDKSLEQLNAEEKATASGLLAPPKNHVEHECIPPSIRDFNKIVHAEQVDLSAKLQEDPLMAIKKREEEARRAFLQNPVQLKKLQKALEAQKKMKSKNKKKKKKRKKSEDDLDAKIAMKLKKLKNTSSLMKKSESTLDTILMHKFNELKDKLSQEDLNDVINGVVTDSSGDEKGKKKRRSNSSSDESEKRKYPKEKYDSSDSEEEKRPKQQNWGLVRSDGSKIPLNRQKVEKDDRREKDSKSKVSEEATRSNERSKHPKRLSAKEKEDKLKEMMRDAEVRDKERSDYVKRYREQNKREEKETTKQYDPEFMNKELRKSANTLSVESRIKSKLNNIQRSSRHMDSNFSKRN